jgi:hypothetical protein
MLTLGHVSVPLLAWICLQHVSWRNTCMSKAANLPLLHMRWTTRIFHDCTYFMLVLDRSGEGHCLPGSPACRTRTPLLP